MSGSQLFWIAPSPVWRGGPPRPPGCPGGGVCVRSGCCCLCRCVLTQLCPPRCPHWGSGRCLTAETERHLRVNSTWDVRMGKQHIVYGGDFIWLYQSNTMFYCFKLASTFRALFSLVELLKESHLEIYLILRCSDVLHRVAMIHMFLGNANFSAFIPNKYIFGEIVHGIYSIHISYIIST